MFLVSFPLLLGRRLSLLRQGVDDLTQGGEGLVDLGPFLGGREEEEKNESAVVDRGENRPAIVFPPRQCLWLSHCLPGPPD